METEGRKKLPIGVSDFRAIMLDNAYYVDKTHLVAKLIDNVCLGGAMLFTRPRRFGKSLALDMLRCFFDCNEREQNRPLFEGLSVAQSQRCLAEQGKYPVICLNFKTAKGGSLEDVIRNLRNAFLEALLPFSYLTRSDRISQRDRVVMDQLLSFLHPESPATLATLNSVSTSLGLVCSLLAKHHGQPVVILVDEYDTPLQPAYINGFYQPVCDLMRNFFSSMLKDNRYLRMGIITGVLRIAKESLFSGINNLEVDTILSKDYADCFGFTQAEVDSMAAYYGAGEKKAEIKEWYDGYRFGQLDIYNPWSVLEYFKHNCQPDAYWLDTSSNDIVKKILNTLAEKQQDQVLALHDGGSVDATIDTAVTYQQLEDLEGDLVFSLLAVSGYLKPVQHLFEDQYRLMIPNKEIKKLYSHEIIRHLQQRLQFAEIRNLRSAIVTGDKQRFAALLRQYMVASLSYYDNTEAFYHGWVMGLLLVLGDDFTCLSNREAGDGRSDIMLVPRPGRNYPGMVFELKRSQTVKLLPEKATEALKQIEDKNYIAGFPPQITEVVGYGMAFCRKRCEVVQRVWQR